MDAEKLRQDFPILQQKQPPVYFDNACTTFKPKSVIDAVNAYNTVYPACAGRSLHKLSAKVDSEFSLARDKVAKFVGAKPEEIVWTKNTTEAINLVAHSLDYSKRKKVVMTNLEHHALILPFSRMAQKGLVQVGYAMADGKTFEIPDSEWENKIDDKTALVAVHHTNNTLGTSTNLKKIIEIAHGKGALVLVDAAQGVPHHKIDFKGMGADFLAFSGHKMLGPTGIGCLAGKYSELEKLDTFILGGETIETATLDGFVLKKPPKKFEAGIQNYAGAIGLGAACDYLSKVGMQNIGAHEKTVCKRIFDAMKSMDKIQIYGPEEFDGRAGNIVFNVKGAKSPHEVAITLSEMSGVCVRSGMFCAQPATEFLGAPKGAVRLSLYLYNTAAEADKFVEALQKAVAILSQS